ncbi:MAG: hypothetical protein DRG33_01585 [Deltaproteobacteria bacterium]|nr:MAG: hypothetical protein DRG33_01585 [Deltaproteobacteria bacterium]
MAELPEDLQNFLKGLFGVGGYKAFLEVVGKGAPVGFRGNTLKATDHQVLQLLQEEGFSAEAIEGIPHAYLVTHEPFPLGKSFSHFLGNIYIQDPSSMLPPLALEPQPGELVLDLAAAPGSKTTQMAALMKNQGLIVANDPKVRRTTFLSFNLMRTGVVNAVVTVLPGNRLGRLYFETFDRVLLDPPCSALGTVKTAPEALRWWRRAEKLSRMQFDLMVSAIKALRPGGVLVYSTCTLTPEENEAVVAEALRRYPVELEEVNLKGVKYHPGLTFFGERAFPDEMSKAVRVYPHEGPGEGFFIARLKKISGMKPPLERPQGERIPLVDSRHPSVRDSLRALVDHFALPEDFFNGFLFERAKELRIFTPEAALLPYLKYSHRGLPIARAEGLPPTLTTWGAQFLGRLAKENVVNLQDPTELLRYLRKEELPLMKGGVYGQQIVLYKGHPVGYGVAIDGRLKSRAKVRKEVFWPFCLQIHS